MPPRDNNWENHRLNFIAAAGALLDEGALPSYAFEAWKRLMADQIDAAGFIKTELDRTLSLNYSMFALEPMIQTAEVARHRGVNLYDYTKGSNNLKKVLDTYASYMTDLNGWPYEQIKAFSLNWMAIDNLQVLVGASSNQDYSCIRTTRVYQHHRMVWPCQ